MSLIFQLEGETQECVLTIPEIEKRFNIRYLLSLDFANWQVEQWIRKQCARAQKRKKIDALQLWLGKYHKSHFDTPPQPDITIRWIDPKMGYGVFTRKPIEKWSFIGEYTGLLRRRNLFKSNINDYCFMYPRKWLACKAFTIDSERQGNFTRFINHRDRPNCESIALFHDGIFKVIFRAVEDIPAGAELSYDYGDLFWRGRSKRLDHDLS